MAKEGSPDPEEGKAPDGEGSRASPEIGADNIAAEYRGTQALFDPKYIRERHGQDFPTPKAALAAYARGETLPGLDPSPFFSAKFYKSLHHDVARKDQDPLRHYLLFGRKERRVPHPLFDPSHVLAQARAAGQTVEPENVYVDFLCGRLEYSPHKLVDLEYIRKQSAENLTALEIFRLIADPEKSLPFSPHPLFDAEYYSAANTSECVNQLIDYLMFRRIPKRPSPFFNDNFYSVSADLSSRQPAPLLHYLDRWHQWKGSTNILVDTKFLYENLSRAGVSFPGDPLSAYVSNGLYEISCHSQVNAEMISFAFTNLQKSKTSPATLKDVLANFGQIVSGVDSAGIPDISIVILNYHKPVLTYLCICAALNAMRGCAVEILVLENGGDPFHFEILSRTFAETPAVRFVKLRQNRFFGEGNNIGTDLTRGKYVMFLNNDCFLRQDFGEALHRHLAEFPDACVGACLVYPNGLIQEFGGLVSDAGEVIQRAKRLDADFLGNRSEPEEVDYTSAACSVFPRAMLQRFAGFDPAFEPFYYEDTDLMRRIRETGGKVLVNPLLRAVHIENASTTEFLSGKFDEIVRAHQSLFARRWLKHSGASVLGVAPAAPVQTTLGPLPPGDTRTKPIVVLYTPFDIGPGGGERYLLTAAKALSSRFEVAICSRVETSTARVRFAFNALGIAPFPFRMITWDQLVASDKADLLLVMGNEIVPPVPPVARRNLFHLQFPFPWRNVGMPDFDRVRGFDCIVVNSDFTAEWAAWRFREAKIHDHPPIRVIHPPIRTRTGVLPSAGARQREQDGVSVISVGRFFVGGHSKRQDVFLDIIEEANRRSTRPIRGTLVGAPFDDAESAAFVARIEARARASGLVRVILNASQDELMQELAASDVYLHCAGYDVPQEVFPERLEHFGITIVESIFVGCYPVLYDAGGPKEILQKGGFGQGFGSISEAAEILVRFAQEPERYQAEIAGANADWFSGLTDDAFTAQILSLAKAVLPDSDATASGAAAPRSDNSTRRRAKS